jgi:hypothetical protein
MKKEGSLGRRKNTFEKKKSLLGFAGSPEFRFDPTGQPVYFRLIVGSNQLKIGFFRF